MKTTKQCNSCDKIKTIDNFSIKKSNKDGYMNICKSCKKDKDILYTRSINGIITKCYIAHRSRAKKENYELSYTKQHLIEWFNEQVHFIEVYERWADHDYIIDYYPSISKIDKHKQYSIDNIQLLGWKDKLDQCHIEAVERAKSTNKIKRENNKIISKRIRDKNIATLKDRTNKICNKCNKDKLMDQYHNSKSTLDGKTSNCKECNNKDYLDFVRTKDGTAYRIYKSQVQRSERKGLPKPTYTYDELREWLHSQEIFHEIYNQWTMSGYDTMLCVSCDRDDRHKGYSLDNITVGTWQQNFDRYMTYRL